MIHKAGCIAPIRIYQSTEYESLDKSQTEKQRVLICIFGCFFWNDGLCFGEYRADLLSGLLDQSPDFYLFTTF